MIPADTALRRGAQMLLDLLYPPQCMTCSEPVLEPGKLCGLCWGKVPFIFGLVCDLCGAPLPGSDPGYAVHCDDCLRLGGRIWSQGRAVLLYEEGAKPLVLGLKHADRTQLARPLAGWMAQAGAQLLRPGRLLVPVPLHWRRLVVRRYNQSALLAQALGRQSGLETAVGALVRRRATPKLDGVSKADRLALLDGAIRPHPRQGKALQGREIVLIDDVLTSGATLTAATRAAQSAGATKVCVLVLARVAKG